MNGVFSLVVLFSNGEFIVNTNCIQNKCRSKIEEKQMLQCQWQPLMSCEQKIVKAENCGDFLIKENMGGEDYFPELICCDYPTGPKVFSYRDSCPRLN